MVQDWIKSVKEPETKGGLYIITYLDENCNEYTSHVNELNYKIAQMKEIFKQSSYDLVLIEEFENLIREDQLDTDSYNILCD